MTIHKETIAREGELITMLTLNNQSGFIVKLCSFAASIYSISFKDRVITLQPNNLDDFIKTNMNYGKTIGPLAGRTHKSPYQINRITYRHQDASDDPYILHSGSKGFSNINFEVYQILETKDALKVTFKHIHLESSSLPGDITLYVSYTLYQDETLKISYEATSTKDTYLNLTNHTYFNLNGPNKSIHNHTLYMPLKLRVLKNENHDYIGLEKPSGLYDFTKPKKLLKGLKYLNGYDDGFYIMDNPIILSSPTFKYALSIKTNYPSVVIYTHNIPSKALENTIKHSGKHQGIAIECQYIPGGIHEKEIAMPLLKKGTLFQKDITIQMIKKPTVKMFFKSL